MEPLKAAHLLAKEIHRRTETTGLDSLFPDEGPLRRELYPKHTAMFAAGLEHNERCCLGGNRVGKTLSIGGYETAIHLTGLYPDWWEGWRLNKPMIGWAGGTKAVKVRDVNQKFLVGLIQPDRQLQGGLIPAHRIKRYTRKSHGVADAIDQLMVKHTAGWENTLTFKSYEEGRTSFEAEGIDWIWLDEEPSREIYDECKLRLLTTKGRILSTMTPVEGMTECVLGMLEGTDLI